jgi:hypothetical protein
VLVRRKGRRSSSDKDIRRQNFGSKIEDVPERPPIFWSLA